MKRTHHRVGPVSITVWGNGLAVSITYPDGSEAFTQDESIAPALADAIDASEVDTILDWVDRLADIAVDPE